MLRVEFHFEFLVNRIEPLPNNLDLCFEVLSANVASIPLGITISFS